MGILGGAVLGGFFALLYGYVFMGLNAIHGDRKKYAVILRECFFIFLACVIICGLKGLCDHLVELGSP